jgi:hapalindole H/12-epi-hapalindole U/12-epi-fischerindole U synthase
MVVMTNFHSRIDWLRLGLLGALLAFAGQTVRLHAELIPVENPGFEDTAGGIEFNEFTFGPPPGWQLYDPNGLVLNNGAGPNFWVGTLAPTPPEFFEVPAPQGQRVAILYNVAGLGNLGAYGLQQILARNLLPNTRYRLQVDVGNIASGNAINGDFFNLDGFPGYRVDLLAGDTVIASDSNLLAGLIDEGNWGTSTVEFQADSVHPLVGQPLGIRLVNLNMIDSGFPSADLEVDFDHVRLSMTAVPEPSSLIALSLALYLGCEYRCQRNPDWSRNR